MSSHQSAAGDEPEHAMIDEQLSEVLAITRRLQVALRTGDLDAIARCYNPFAAYSDPVLGDLGAGSARQAWSLILPLLRSPSWSFSIDDVGLLSSRASTRLTFLFAPTARPVTLDISTVLQVRDGRIVRHDDDFSLFAWSQGLPFPQRLVARSRSFRRRVNREARGGIATVQETRIRLLRDIVCP